MLNKFIMAVSVNYDSRTNLLRLSSLVCCEMGGEPDMRLKSYAALTIAGFSVLTLQSEPVAAEQPTVFTAENIATIKRYASHLNEIAAWNGVTGDKTPGVTMYFSPDQKNNVLTFSGSKGKMSDPANKNMTILLGNAQKHCPSFANPEITKADEGYTIFYATDRQYQCVMHLGWDKNADLKAALAITEIGGSRSAAEDSLVMFGYLLGIVGQGVKLEGTNLTELKAKKERFESLKPHFPSTAVSGLLGSIGKEMTTWNPESYDTISVFSSPDGFSKIVSYLGEVEKTTDKSNEKYGLLTKLASDNCPEFSSAPEEDAGSFRVKGNSGPKIRCTLFTSTNDKGAIFATLLLDDIAGNKKRVDHAFGVHVLSKEPSEKRIIGSGAPVAAASSPTASYAPAVTPAAQNAKQAQAASGSSASLKAAIDKIPADRRPIGLVYTEGGWDSYNMMTKWVPHLLFPNGITISPDCKLWDPMRPITKDTAMGCYYDSYRLEGRTAYIDGKGQSIDDYQGFKKGERLSVNFSTVGGLAMNGLNPGVNSTWGGDLTMTPEGRIGVGSWSGASMSGAGYTAYGGSEGQSIVGEYYLDGYIIGIMDDQGNISVDFIWQQDGQYIFLNGEQYNR
jgi:hypothetical protein